MKPNGHGLVDIRLAPEEPPSPPTIEPERLAHALRQLCGWMPPQRPQKYATWMVEAAALFKIDPMLLGGLVYAQSQCRPKHKTPAGVGLTAIAEKMHLDHVRKRRYRYHVPGSAGGWAERHLDISRHLFYEGSFLQAKSNVYFAAALLRVWSEQCPHIDGSFGSVRHRHFVSHAYWGDRVRGTDAEDRILRARRRLIQYYRGASPTAGGVFGTELLVSPLDGGVRKLTSAMGDERDGGSRSHKGIDFSSTLGEPVRAVAAGTVTFAGVAERGRGSRSVTPTVAAGVDRGSLRPAGLFVMVRHASGLVSAYMHLDSYSVNAGDTVKAGQLIGRVGRTGMKRSAPHLHFELRWDGKHLDPVPHLGAMVIRPELTWRGFRMFLDRNKRR